MELRGLYYIVVIAEEGSISRAADRLYMAQSSLSQFLQKYESELGAKLFMRTASGVRPTYSGEQFVRGARQMLQQYHRLKNELCDIEQLRGGRIDFGVFIGQTDLSRYETIELPARDTWGVFMREDDPLAQLDVIRAEDLLDRPLIFSRQASQEMRRWFKHDFAELDIVATYNLLFNAALLARRGVGYVVSLEDIVDTSAGSGLAFRPLDPPMHANITIAWKRYQEFSPAASVFLDKIRSLWGA